MSKVFAFMALLTLFAVARGAGAAEAIGWIMHLDYESDRIVLDDGRIFGVSEEINFSSLRDGVRVRIHYDSFAGDKIANDIILAPQALQSVQHPRSGKAAPSCGEDKTERLVGNLSISPSTSC